MDPHQPPHPVHQQQPQHPLQHDQSRYAMFQQHPYQMPPMSNGWQSQQTQDQQRIQQLTPQDALPIPHHPYHDIHDQKQPRITRNRAAAIAKQPPSQSDQQSFEPPTHYAHAGYQLAGDQPANPYPHGATGPTALYPYHHAQATFQPQQAQGSHSPPDPATPAAPLLPQFYGYPQQFAPVDHYATADDPAATVYSAGPEMRVPSASPSVASVDLSSPPPGDATPSLDRAHPSSRSSSRPHSLDNYDQPPGPISPMSSNYNAQPLPSSLTSITGGYLHDGRYGGEADDDTGSSINSRVLTSPSIGTKARSANQKTKTKLTDMDRKFICVFAINNPKARQEDIATKFAVERSTVSKILKSKDKWMKVDFFSSEARVVKHRPSKFPELEETLIQLLRERSAAREPINDSFIKKKALELADERGIGKDKFKASSGWVENFKHRHDLRKGSMWDKVGSGANSWPAAKSDPSAGEPSLPADMYRHQGPPPFTMQAPMPGYMTLAPPAVGAQ